MKITKLLLSAGSPLALVLACGAGEQAEPAPHQSDSADESGTPNITTIIEKNAAGALETRRIIETDVPTLAISADEYHTWSEQQLARGAVRDDTPPPSPTAEAVELAASRAPTEKIPLMVRLQEPAFAFGRFREAKKAATPEDARATRAALVVERREQLRIGGQSEIAARLVAVESEVIYLPWLTNSVRADVPAEYVEVLASWPEVVGLEYQDPQAIIVPSSDGYDLREDTLAKNLISAGFDGSSGGLNNWAVPNVVIGFIESAQSLSVRRGHPAFQEAPGNAASRFGDVFNCNPNCFSSSSTGTANSDSTQSHGTTVAWIAAGSIMNGIHPQYPNGDGVDAFVQEQRSGFAQESYMFYYRTSTTEAVANAIEQAIFDGVDIINLSGAAAIECANVNTRTYNSNLNASISNVLNAGILFVNAAGNGHSSGDSCSIRYPGWRPDVLAVGGAATENATTLRNAFLSPDSSRGLSSVAYDYGGQVVETSHPSVALVGPGCVEHYPSSSTGFDNGNGGSRCGTSYAAPAVSGSAALLKDAFDGIIGLSGKELFTNMLLMGEGWWSAWNGNLDETWGLEQTSAAQWASPSSGFGKLSMHFPRSSDPTMGSGSLWRWTVPPARTVTQGWHTWWPANGDFSSGANLPFPANATQFKWAFAYFPTSMNDYGSMGMEVWEAPCNTGNPLSGTLRAYDWTTSSRKRIQMFGSAIANKCLWLVVKPYSTPGNSVQVYNAFYYHSGNTLLH